MSIAIHVFLPGSRLPTVGEWNAAIKAEGFDLTLEAFDLRTDSGYRPATLQGEESGFEWFLSPNTYFAESPESAERAQVSECDLDASLGFGSRENEHMAACIAGAVLVKITGGFYLDDESGSKLLRGEEAIAAARLMLAKWLARSQSPAKFITSATTAIFAPVLNLLGFMRVKPRVFARMEQGIVQTFSIDARNAEFRGSWAAEPLYPIQEFFSLKFSPFGVRLDDWHNASSPEQTDIAMKIVVAALLKHIYPWFEETKSDSDFLDFLLEFHNTSHHDLFEIGCLLAKLGRLEEAIEKLKLAVFEYGDDGRDWCLPKITQCRELLSAISAGAASELLESWKIQSLHNLGLKKLSQPPRSPKIKTPSLPIASQSVPPVITTDRLRNGAMFSRQIVKPSLAEMVKRVLPGFHLMEQRGEECRFLRAGSAGLFDYVIFLRNWAGAIGVELAASYNSIWKRGQVGPLGHSTGLANLRLGLDRIQLSYHNVWHQNWYVYGRSAEELQKQIHQLEAHLAVHAPPFFKAARQMMQSRKLVQFGIKQVMGNPLTEDERAALKKEHTASLCYTAKPIINSRFVELSNALKQFAVTQADIPKDECDRIGILTQELLLADLSVHF